MVGRVNREYIYSFNHDYQHITVRTSFRDYLLQREKTLDSTAIAFMTRFDPLHSIQSNRLTEGVKKGPIDLL